MCVDAEAEARTTFGALLRDHRRTAGLTQEALAERAGMSARSVRALERGVNKPQGHTARHLAEALGLDDAERAGFMASAAPVPRRRTAPATGPFAEGRVPSRTLPPALSAPPTPLLGREADVDAVTTLLRRDEVRLLTLVGPGGVGKTRLALHVAADLRRDGGRMVAVVGLADLREPGLLAATIARALGLRDVRDQDMPLRLGLALRERRALLLLDNVEHLLAQAPLVASLLAACPLLTVLATSRAPLRVRGEQEYAVSPLPVPDTAQLWDLTALTRSAAVQLFVQRARSVRPDFQLTAGTGPPVGAICRRLDGLPLAIELAATRIKVLPPQALLARLVARDPAEPMADALPTEPSTALHVLTGGPRDLPARLQTMRAAIAWSHDLLTDDERVLFRRLAIVAGGCTLEAAEAICSGPPLSPPALLEGVVSLVDKSLLQAEDRDAVEGRSESTPRLRMLETIREYALEQLAASGEAEVRRRRHALHYLALVEGVEPALNGPEQAHWMAHLAHELDNLRAALGWALERDEVGLGLRLAGALRLFWHLRGYVSEGERWLGRLLARDEALGRPGPPRVRAKALLARGEAAWASGALERAETACRESLALFQELDDRLGSARSLLFLAFVARDRGDDERSVVLADEGLGLFRALGDTRGTVLALASLGGVALHAGDPERAAPPCAEALDVARSHGDTFGIAVALVHLGRVARLRGAYDEAGALLEESLALRRALGDRWSCSYTLADLGLVAECRGDETDALARYRESAALCRELGDAQGLAVALVHLERVTAALGDADGAAALRRERRALGQDQSDTWVWSLPDALLNLGHVARARNDHVRALARYTEAARIYHDAGYIAGVAACVDGMASAVAARGDAPPSSPEHMARVAHLRGLAATLREPPASKPGQGAIDDEVALALRAALGEDANDRTRASSGASMVEGTINATRVDRRDPDGNGAALS